MVQRVAGHDQIDAAIRQGQVLDRHGGAVKAGDGPAPGHFLKPLHHDRADVNGQHPAALLGQRQAELTGAAPQVDNHLARLNRSGVQNCRRYLPQPGRAVLIPARGPERPDSALAPHYGVGREPGQPRPVVREPRQPLGDDVGRPGIDVRRPGIDVGRPGIDARRLLLNRRYAFSHLARLF